MSIGTHPFFKIEFLLIRTTANPSGDPVASGVFVYTDNRGAVNGRSDRGGQAEEQVEEAAS